VLDALFFADLPQGGAEGRSRLGVAGSRPTERRNMPMPLWCSPMSARAQPT
jgi:hypothetical protein